MRSLSGLLLLLLLLPTAAQAATPPKNPADYVVGRYQRQGEAFAIDIKTDGATGVVFEGLHTDWKGEYKKGDDTTQDKLIFRRKPSADEMSHDAPLWARQKVAGQLEWRLELEINDCSDITLTGKWYPGEIKWRDDSGTQDALVNGDGKPVDVEYERVQRESEIWAGVTTTPAIRIVPPGHPLALGSLASVVKDQPFMPVVRIGPTLAESVGDVLTVTLTTASGRKATVQAHRYGGAKAIPVVYMPDEPVILADHIGAFLPDFLGGKISNETVRLEVTNGEMVTAEYGGSTTHFKVYNSWVQQGIAANTDNFERMDAMYAVEINDSIATIDEREVAYQKRRFIEDFRILMKYQPKSDENFTDYSRFEIAQAYAQLLGSATIQPGQRASPYVGSGQVDKYGVRYATAQEKTAVSEAIAAGRQRYTDAFQGMSRELLIGSYDFIVQQTGAAQFVAVVWGIDTMGNPIDTTDRVFAGIGLGAQLLLVGTNAAGELQKMQTETALTQAYEDALKDGAASLERKAAATMAANEDAAAGAESAVGRAMERPGDTTPVGMAGKKPNFLRIVTTGDEAALDHAYNPHVLDDRQLRWRPLDGTDPNFEIPTTADPMGSKGTPAQIGDGSCGIAVSEGIQRDEGFAPRDEKLSVKKALDEGNFDPITVNSKRGNYRGGGMTNKQLAAHLEEEGAKTRVLRSKQLDNIYQTMTKGLKDGKKYALLVNAGSEANPAWHWVRYEGLSCSGGKAFAHIGDPWPGTSLKMPTKMLRGRINSVVEADFADFHKMMQ